MNNVQEELTDKTIRQSDKVKVARVIADMLGVERAESLSPDVAVNAGLRKIKNKRMTPELIGVIHKMLALASEVGVRYDETLVPKAVTEESESPVVDKKSKRNAAKDVLRFSDYQKLSKINDGEVPLGTGITARKVGEETEEHPVVEKQRKKLHTMKTAETHPSDTPNTEVNGENPSEAGHTLDLGDQDQIRRRKVSYKVDEEVDLEEDIYSADFKINPQTGRKSRSHRIEFKASGAGGVPEKDQDEKEKPIIQTKPLMKPIKEEYDVAELTDPELEHIANQVDDEEDVLEFYEPEELVVIDADTGEEVELPKEEVSEEVLNEVLSRMERMKARMRFARTSAKRERRLQIILKRHSDTKTLNKRARRLAVNLLKQRLMKKPVSQMTVSEKERAERMIQARKNLINRLAMRLAPRIRRIEQNRLTHTKTTITPPSPGI